MTLRIEGEVDNRDELIEKLQQENDDLRKQLREAERQVRLAKSIADNATRRLRTVLEPLYRALQQVFGELDVINPESESSGSYGFDTRNRAVWESWKSKLGKTCATVIDALLEYGPLDSKALVVATKLNRTTLPRPLGVLRKAGLLTPRSDGKYELRQL